MASITNKIRLGGRRVLNSIHRAIYELNLKLYGEEYLIKLAKRRFNKKMGRPINWENPQTINEIINRTKILSNTTLWSTLADKYEVREYVKSKGLESTLVELYGVWNSAKEVDFDSLPTSFILKPSNGCAKVMVVKDLSQLDISTTRDSMQSWLDNRFGYKTIEPHYLRIEPKIIAERLLIPDKGDTLQATSLIDYKWYCFNGYVSYVLVASNRTRAHTCDMAIYDKDWVDNSHFIDKRNKRINAIPKPQNLEQMIQICQTLSEGVPFVRIDLYEVGGKVYFGEMTMTPAAGYSRSMTEQFDELMGREYHRCNPQFKTEQR